MIRSTKLEWILFYVASAAKLDVQDKKKNDIKQGFLNDMQTLRSFICNNADILNTLWTD